MSELDTPCRILVVDDDESVRAALSTMLQGLGAEIAGEAGDGDEAVAAFGACNPDISLLDIMMPGKDGVEALKEILTIDPDAFVVMLTAKSDMDVTDACIEAGARNYISKGVGPEILYDLLRAQLHAFAVGSKK